MKEQYILRILALALLFGASCTAVEAQVKDEPKAYVAAATKTRADKGESPIRVEQTKPNLVGQSSEGKVSFLFFNTTRKPIRAFSYVTETDSYTRLAVTPYNLGHRPELALIGSLFSDGEDPRFTFDWVLFADGSTWGPDDHGRSREILGYFKGWHTAATRAGDLVGQPDSEVLMRSLDGPWMISWGIELPLKSNDTRGEKEYFRKGYENVISDLLNDREISKLKLPKQITDQLKKELKEIQNDAPIPNNFEKIPPS
ncbi:hypothetical protein BH20ACI2_BH20ACI2_09640 [soil metagenome]